VPRVPVPPEVDAFLVLPNPAVVATVAADGTPHSAATWYDWVDGRALLNMDEGRLRLGHLRANPSVSLTVLADGDWYRHVTVSGRIGEIVDDEGLADIDRLALRYTGRRYGNRESRRFSAWLEPERWHAWPLAK